MSAIIDIFQSINAVAKVMTDAVITAQKANLAFVEASNSAYRFLIAWPDRCNAIRENLEEMINNPLQKGGRTCL